MKLTKTKIDLNQIKNTESIGDFIEIENQYQQPLAVVLPSYPEYFRFEAQPSTLKPGEKGKLFFYIDGSKKQEFGKFTDRVEIRFEFANTVKSGYLYFNGSLNQDFSGWTRAQLQSAPELTLDQNTLDAADLKIGEVKAMDIIINNSGHSPLLIHNVQTERECRLLTYPGQLQPGEKGIISIALEPSVPRKTFNTTLRIISNDPAHPEQVVRIKGNIGT